MRYEFTEVLNDLIDYFLLGDIQLLDTFKQNNDLPDDLAHAFTTSDAGDQAVREGVILPLAGIDNLPYHILFTLDDLPPALLEPGSRLKHRRPGHVLRVENGALMLYTWRILQHFTHKTLGALVARYREPGRPIIELDNGWYEVEVLAGALVRDGLYEPAFEFVLKRTYQRSAAVAIDTAYQYGLRGYFD